MRKARIACASWPALFKQAPILGFGVKILPPNCKAFIIAQSHRRLQLRYLFAMMLPPNTTAVAQQVERPTFDMAQ